MTPEDFRPFRETLPNLPGIYKYINEQEEIIYIGKAKDLKKRVSSYFVLSQQHSNRIKRMVHFIHKFDGFRQASIALAENEQVDPG